MISKPLPRGGYKQHLERLGKNCAFCGEKDSLSIKEYKNWTLAYAAFPYRKYHTLIFSKRHVTQFSELGNEELTELGHITKEVNQMYTKSGIIGEHSKFGDQLYFSWRNRSEAETEKKAVSHFHVHVYPEMGKEITLVLDEEAWNIDISRLNTAG